MAKRQFRVCHGSSIIGRDGRRYIGGQLVSEEVLNPDPKIVDETVDGGFLIAASDYAAPEEPRIVEDVPGRDPLPAIRATGDGDELPITVTTNGPDGSRTESLVLPGEVESAADLTEPLSPAYVPSDIITQSQSKWTIDPETLVGKSVEELNVMVAEIDSSVAPFNTVGEATYYLSRDFVRTNPAR